MSQPFPPSSGTEAPCTPVSMTNESKQLLAANLARVKFIITNPPGSPTPANRLFIRWGSPCSNVPGEYSVFLDPGGVYESFIGEWVGEVTGFLNGTGPTVISVTELK